METPVKDQPAPPYEGFSERVTDGSDEDRQNAYGRWLKRLRGSQAGSEAEQESSSETRN